MKELITISVFAIASIAWLEYTAIQHGIDGIALAASVGAISAIISSLITYYKLKAKYAKG